jgi:hypothetical protein
MSKHSSSFLGSEITYNADEGAVVHSAAHGGGGFRPPSGGGGGSGGTPAPSLVVSSGSNLEFNLVWDSSVASAPSGFMQAVVNVAKYYESLFTTSSKEIINIHVGWGEIGGQSLSAGALGESQSNGYLTNFATVTSHLPGYSFTASNEPTSAQFYITSAQTKAFGLINPMSSATDGYIGFGTLSSTGYSWNYNSSPTSGAGSNTGSHQVDFQSVVQHEITEVMGRIGIEGQHINGAATYSVLDLFNYNSHGALELSGGGGYFSTDNGTTHLGWFNNSSNGGDIADWASYSSPFSSGTVGLVSGDQDAYDAFGYAGLNGAVSQSDVLLDHALGFSLTTLGVATA